MRDYAAPSGRSDRFEAWETPARPKAQIWRVVLGSIVAMLIWVLVTLVVMAGLLLYRGLFAGVELDDAMNAVVYDISGFTIVGSVATLLSIGGLWLGVWAALALHGRKLGSILSPEGRMRWGEFGAGMLVGGGYLAIGVGLGLAMGDPPYRSQLDIGTYLIALAPMLAAILVQTSAEEAFFRGYLLQNLAARFRNPIIWGGVPAVLFGALHFGNGSELSLEFGLYYIAATFLMAVAAIVMVWRTGSIAAAMGLHFINNAVVLLGVGSDDFLNSTQLWLYPAADMVDIAVWDLIPLALLAAYVASPWAPFPRRRKETLAAP